jgi:hypothetical protein
LIDDGLDMPAALALAEEIAPASAPPRPVANEPTTRGVRPRHAADLEVNFVGDGYVVYDRARRRMHSLNNTAAVVFELCTGENDEGEIGRLLQRAYELPTPPVAEVRTCLDSLAKEQLIT